MMIKRRRSGHLARHVQASTDRAHAAWRADHGLHSDSGMDTFRAILTELKQVLEIG